MHTKTPGMSLYVLLLIIYKFLLDFVFLKVYYSVYAYLINGTYEWNPIKYLISVVFFGVFLLLTYANPTENSIQRVVVTLFMVICIVPMLSVYAFLSYVIDIKAKNVSGHN